MSPEQRAVDTLRVLSIDAIQRADSGHPGMPMGMADIAVVLWGRHLRVDPSDPLWPDRDRFVLSNGHGSMLLYSLLHLSGFPVTMDDITAFRQWGSATPGHPEREPHLGIETTTGPLGQGLGTAVGMAIAEAHLRATLGEDLVDHRTYAFVGDGDLMEGISSEAASLAGRLVLGKITFLYDDNEISIEGSTDLAFTEDVLARFTSFGWHTLDVDGHDRQAVDQAITAAAADPRPSLIACHTRIAYGAPTLEGTAASHGSPLGAAEITAYKESIGWDLPQFEVPDEVREFFAAAMDRGRAARQAWLERSQKAFTDPERRAAWERHFQAPTIEIGDLGYQPGERVETRKASGRAINRISSEMPGLIGGSADLAPSTNTLIAEAGEFQDSPSGHNLRFGVREHAMGAAVNGIAIHGGLRPFGATFLVFSDYMRPSIRLAALMGAPSIFVFTHDSVFLGEDGPTHQPIEHLASLRAIPGLHVVRPADAGETAEAWEMALERTEGPTALVLTRQAVPVLDRTGLEGAAHRGGYVLRPGTDLVLIATGSEVWVALEAADLLAAGGVSAQVVSLPCWEAFLEQDDEYRTAVLGDGLPRVSLEAASPFGWERFVGIDGLRIGIDRFGASAPWERIAEEMGLTSPAVASRIEHWLSGR